MNNIQMLKAAPLNNNSASRPDRNPLPMVDNPWNGFAFAAMPYRWEQPREDLAHVMRHELPYEKEKSRSAWRPVQSCLEKNTDWTLKTNRKGWMHDNIDKGERKARNLFTTKTFFLAPHRPKPWVETLPSGKLNITTSGFVNGGMWNGNVSLAYRDLDADYYPEALDQGEWDRKNKRWLS